MNIWRFKVSAVSMELWPGGRGTIIAHVHPLTEAYGVCSGG